MTRLRFLGRLAPIAGLALAVVLRPSPSDATVTKDQCVDANARAQDQRRAGKLSLAKEQLRTCADPSCPDIVRSDCIRRLDDLQSAQPSLVFDVKDAAGADVVDVEVTVDGQPLAHRLDGSPVEVDPGVHAFIFQVSGAPPAKLILVVKEGELRRHERVVLGAPAAVLSQAGTAAPAAATGMGTQRILGLSFGGAGVVGVVVGSAFGLMASSAWSSAKSACGGNPGACTNVASGRAFHSTMETDGAVSTSAFIVGGALLVAGGVLFFTAGHAEARSAATVSVAPSVGPGAAGVLLGGAF
jgi:hypothetical protein